MKTRASMPIAIAAAVVCCLSAAGQQPIPAPVLKPFADNRDWVLMENLRYQIGQTSTVIVVPKGFVTDFAVFLRRSGPSVCPRTAVIAKRPLFTTTCTGPSTARASRPTIF